jgi:glycolate oxidase iron-sulfur subunit
MQIQLSPEFQDTPDGEAAEAILRKCVHCGFCNATCPTYQLLGDELDGPRGRIYLIKQALEGAPVTRLTQTHLDRCLTCLNCETTCPSGVKYGRLVDIGRKVVAARVPRPAAQRLLRWLLRTGLTSPLFGAALRVGQVLRPWLPAALKKNLPPVSQRQTAGVVYAHPRKVLLLRGCVQPSLAPNIDAATARVLDRVGIQTVCAVGTGCCGAVRAHLGDDPGALDDMRRNIDAWFPMIASGEAQAIITSASACSLSIKEYGHALSGDAHYADKAARISALALDLSEMLPQIVPALQGSLRLAGVPRLAFHPPCTLQHGQGLRGGVQMQLRTLGFDVDVAACESHLCCGSAGTYSILQPDIARTLRDRKLGNLAALEPGCIVSANMGCIRHLQSGTSLPVKHWIEVLDEALLPAGAQQPKA